MFKRENQINKGRSPWNKGLKTGKQSSEHIEKRRLKLIGLKRSDESKKRIGLIHKGLRHTLESKKKMSESHLGSIPWNKGKHTGLIPKTAFKDNDLRITGENNRLWKNGISKINKTEREILWYSGKYRRWRKSVFERDNYTCQICGARSGNGFRVYLNADHIKPWALYPELRFKISNGRALCIDCHLIKTKADRAIIFATRL